MSDEKQSYVALQPHQMTVNSAFSAGTGSAASPHASASSMITLAASRPGSSTPGGRRSIGVELTTSPRHRGAAAAGAGAVAQQLPQSSPRLGESNNNDRCHSSIEMFNEDEEEQMKMEAQIGMLLAAAR